MHTQLVRKRTLGSRSFSFLKTNAAQIKQWSQILGIPVKEATSNSYISCADLLDKKHIDKMSVLENLIPETPAEFTQILSPNNICPSRTTATSDNATIISEDNKRIIFQSINPTVPNIPSEIPSLVWLPQASVSKINRTASSNPPPLCVIDNVVSNIPGHSVQVSTIQMDSLINVNQNRYDIPTPNIGDSINTTNQISNTVQAFNPFKPINFGEQAIINESPENDDISFTNFPPLRLISPVEHSSTIQPCYMSPSIQNNVNAPPVSIIGTIAANNRFHLTSTDRVPAIASINENRNNEDIPLNNFPPLRLIPSGEQICEKHFDENDVMTGKLKKIALPKKPCFGQTVTEPNIEYLPVAVEESPINDIIFVPAQQPIKIEGSDMVHTEAPIKVSTLSSTINVKRKRIIGASTMTLDIKNAPKSQSKKAKVSDGNIGANLPTETNAENRCKKCTQLLAIEQITTINIADYEEKCKTGEPIATEKRNYVYELRKKYQLQKKIARRKRKIIAGLGKRLKMEQHRYGLLKNIAKEQAEFVKEISFSERPKTIAKQIKNIVTIKQPKKKQKFAAVYIVT